MTATALLPDGHPPGLLRRWLHGWRALAFLVSDLVIAVPSTLVAVFVFVGVCSLPALGFGLVFLLPALGVAHWIGGLQLTRIRALLGARITPRRPPSGGSWWRRVLATHRWRTAGYCTLQALWSVLVGTVALTLVSQALVLALAPYLTGVSEQARVLIWLPVAGNGVLLNGVALVLVLLAPLLAEGVSRVDVQLARWLLGEDPVREIRDLTDRVETLTTSRSDALDSVEQERRRIERDLHDGPQQRLVAIALELGMAKQALETDPERARELIDRAHAASKEAVTEMREVARGITPPVLSDRGLSAALSALAARSPVPVAVRVELAERPEATLEAIAYFCCSEALTNVAKHARADRAWVALERQGESLRIEVRDDGIGGAAVGAGTGLSGLAARLRAVDGGLDLDSPVDGPTVLVATLPWRPREDR